MSTCTLIRYDKEGNPYGKEHYACMAPFNNVGRMQTLLTETDMAYRAGPNDFKVGFFAPHQGHETKVKEQTHAFRDAFNQAASEVGVANSIRAQVTPFGEGQAVELVGDVTGQQIMLFSYMARWWAEYNEYRLVQKDDSQTAVLAAMFNRPAKGWAVGRSIHPAGHHIGCAFTAEDCKAGSEKSKVKYWHKTYRRALVEWPREALRRMLDPNFDPEVEDAPPNKRAPSAEDLYNGRVKGNQTARLHGGHRNDWYTTSMRLAFPDRYYDKRDFGSVPGIVFRKVLQGEEDI